MSDEGNPYDIVAAPFGFFVLAANKTSKVSDLAWVASYDYSGK